MSVDGLTIRPLGYSDLPQVIAIERRAFPTPWSLAMFVLELSKPSGVCLAAVTRRSARRLPDLLALRRRLAPDEHRRRSARATRRGSPARCSSRWSSVPDTSSSYTLEVRPSNADGDRALRAVRLSLRGHPAALLPRHRRGRRDHVADGRDGIDPERVRVILALETSCDDTCAAVITQDGEIRANVISSQGDPRSLRRRGPGDRLAPSPRPDRRRRRRRARHGRHHAGSRSTWSRSRAGPGLVGALLVGVATAKALAAAHELPLAAGRPPARARGRRLPGAVEPLRATVPEPDRERRAHSAGARDGPRPGVRGAWPDARRRGRRGVRQGRAAAGPRVSRRPGARAAGAERATRSRSVPDRAPRCRGWTSRSPG